MSEPKESVLSNLPKATARFSSALGRYEVVSSSGKVMGFGATEKDAWAHVERQVNWLLGPVEAKP